MSGGFIVAGATSSTEGGQDVWMVKTDGSGAVLWETTIGGPQRERALAIERTQDGGYVVAGDFVLDGGETAGYLARTDGSGNALWERTIGEHGYRAFTHVETTSDGGFILAGSDGPLGSSGYVAKTDALGFVEWDQSFDHDDGFAVFAHEIDDGFVVAGSTRVDATGYDAYFSKLDVNGTVLSTTTIGGSEGDYAYALRPIDDGYLLAGTSYSNSVGENDAYVAKLTLDGHPIWQTNMGGSDRDAGFSIEPTSDGGYIVAGYTTSDSAGLEDVYLVKLESSGIAKWERRFGGSGTDMARIALPTPSGGYLLAGATDSYGAGGRDGFLILTDPAGNPVLDGG